MRSAIIRGILAAGAVTAAAAAFGAPKPMQPAAKAAIAPLKSLRISPRVIRLQGPFGEARPLVEGATAAGAVRDASSESVISTENPAIAWVDELGIVRAKADGRTALVAKKSGLTARAVVEVSGVRNAPPPRFLADVVPVLTKTGCNMGACHGAGSGKGGFKLSLLGFDPDSDYETLRMGAGVRRVVLTAPEQSLILRKPTLAVAHKGGLRFRTGSPEYRVLAAWIAAGMPGPNPEEPRVASLRVVPEVRKLAVGQQQRYTVRAIYTNGSARDVTGESVFNAGDETVATVTADGEARVTGPGEGPVLVRYQSLVAVARIVSPFAPTRESVRAPEVTATHDSSQRIDRLVDVKLAALGLEPSPRCSDSDFLRRAYLDVTGVPPAPNESREWLADRDPRKRERLVDSLLARGEYVDYWSLRWEDLLRSSRKLLGPKGAASFNYWIRQSVAQNKPWNLFVRELITAQGSSLVDGAANFYRTASTPEALAETTAQAFLGVRMQCAKCHNHPYEKWTQTQYYEMAAFFARVKRTKGAAADDQIITAAASGEVRHLRTGKETAPCALDSRPLPASYTGDRRTVLADWLTSSKNPFFSRILVNRVWRHLMGRGLVEPVDDMRATNPATNEPLLSFLASDFAAGGFDIQRLIRTIMLSQAYQRSSQATPANFRDGKYYSHYLFKRLDAEPLQDALTVATGAPVKFEGFPLGLRAAQLPDAGVPSYFLDLFGRPARNLTCECERNDSPNLGQVLHLINNQNLNARIGQKDARVARLIESKAPDRKVVADLYLAAFARLPNAAEGRRALALLASAKNRQQAAEDLLWALVNSKEFLFNH